MKNAMLYVILISSIATTHAMEDESANVLSASRTALAITNNSPTEKQFDQFFEELKNNKIDRKNPHVLIRLNEIAMQRENLSAAARAKYNAAVIYANAKQYDKAVPLCQEVMQQKDSPRFALRAANNFALMCLSAQGVPLDYSKAWGILNEIAKQTDDLEPAAMAEYNIADMRHKGLGVEVDDDGAIKGYEKVAQQRNNLRAAAAAKYRLAEVCLDIDNKGFAKNNERALQLLIYVSGQTHHRSVAAWAKVSMACMFLNGEGSRKDMNIEAKNLLEEVAEQKYNIAAAADAWRHLADWYARFDVKRNDRMWFHYLKRAALQTENREAQKGAVDDLCIKAVVQMKKDNPIRGLPSAVAIISDQVYSYTIDSNDHHLYVRNVEYDKNICRISDFSRLLKKPIDLSVEPGSTIAIATNEDGSKVSIDLKENKVIELIKSE